MVPRSIASQRGSMLGSGLLTTPVLGRRSRFVVQALVIWFLFSMGISLLIGRLLAMSSPAVRASTDDISPTA